MNLDFLKIWHKCFARHVEFVAEGIEPLDMSAAEISDASRCKLGAWLVERTGTLSKLYEFEQLHVVHSHFHSLCGRVISLHEQSKFEDARGVLPSLLDTSEAVIACISSLADKLPEVGIVDVVHRSVSQMKLHKSVWDEGLLTGVPVIDIQHQGIAETIDTMLCYGEEKLGSKRGTEFLANIKKLYLLHLKTEEAYLRKACGSTKEYEIHIKNHVECVKKFNALQAPEYAFEELRVVKDTLTEILIDHIKFDIIDLSNLSIA